MKEVIEILRLLAKAIEQNTVNTFQEQGCAAADVVEVVRCENCIHRTEEDFCFKVASDVVPKKVKGDFFCGYGKRKEVD